MHNKTTFPVRAREAIPADGPEIVRLVAQVYWDMHAFYGGPPPTTDAQWQDRVTTSLKVRVGHDVAIFVVDGAEGSLASVAVGRIAETLPSPRRANALEGYIEWVGTDPQFRGQGFATAATGQLLNWFTANQALSVSLHASPAAESLYLRMGFSDDGPRALSIRLVDDAP